MHNPCAATTRIYPRSGYLHPSPSSILKVIISHTFSKVNYKNPFLSSNSIIFKGCGIIQFNLQPWEFQLKSHFRILFIEKLFEVLPNSAISKHRRMLFQIYLKMFPKFDIKNKYSIAILQSHFTCLMGLYINIS